MTGVTVEAHRVLSCESRVEILRVLAQAGEALTVDTISAEIGLHHNTVREHLDRLVHAGFATRAAEVRRRRGRPRMLYSLAVGAGVVDGGAPAATPTPPAPSVPAPSAGEDRAAQAGPPPPVGDPSPVGAPSGPAPPPGASSGPSARPSPGPSSGAASTSPHVTDDCAAAVRADLVRVLLDGYRGPGGRAAAEAAGRTWAARHECSVDGQGGSAEAQIAALRTHLTELGFAPAPAEDPAEEVIRLTRCPFGDLMVQGADVVCGVHLGLARGMLDRHPGPLSLVDIRPVAGGGCTVLLGRRG